MEVKSVKSTEKVNQKKMNTAKYKSKQCLTKCKRKKDTGHKGSSPIKVQH